MNRISDFLDRRILPYPVMVMTSAVVITITFGLLLPLVVFKDSVVFVLLANSFLNVSGAGVSMAVLRQSKLAEEKSRRLAEAAEKRAQEDHQALVAILAHLHPEHAETLKELHPRGRSRFQEGDHLAVLNGHRG